MIEINNIVIVSSKWSFFGFESYFQLNEKKTVNTEKKFSQAFDMDVSKRNFTNSYNLVFN